MEQRITFKVLLLTFKVLNNLAPPYLRQLIVPYDPTRNLGSAGRHLLEVPNVRLKSYSTGQRDCSITRVHYTHITRSVHAVPTQCPRSVHAVSTQCPRSCHAVSTHLTSKYTKMRVITRVQFHAVRSDIACKITRSRSTEAH